MNELDQLTQDVDSKIRSLFIKEIQDTRDVKNGAARDIANMRLESLKQRRGFLQNLTIVMLGILGFMPSMIDSINVLSNYQLYTGSILIALDIILVISHLRGALDDESVGLQLQQDKYAEIGEVKIEILERYLEKRELSETDNTSAIEELRQTKAYKMIQQEEKEMLEGRQKRKSGKPMDYFFEFVISLLLLGIIFIGSALFRQEIQLEYIPTVVMVVLFFSFIDISIFVTNFFIFLQKIIGIKSN